MSGVPETAWSDLQWLDVGTLDQIPLRGSRTVVRPGMADIAVIRTGDDRVFALVDLCPHKQGPLSQGIVHGHAVSCPLHNWNIALATGEAQAPDKGCTPVIPVRLDGLRILIGLSDTLPAAA